MDFDVSKVITQYSDNKSKCIGLYGYFGEDPDKLRKLVTNNRTWNNYGEVIGIEDDGRFRIRYTNMLDIKIVCANCFYPVNSLK